jgi:hypothetical protein
MALPIDVNTVIVTGTYLTDDGLPAEGSLIFTPSVATLRDPAYDTIVKLRQQRIELDVTGSFSVSLIATDDPDLIPVGWHYDVTERIEDHPQRVWVMQLPHTLVTVDIADLPSVVDPSGPVYPAPVCAVTSVVGETGDVTGAEILADATITAALAAKANTSALAALVPYTGAAGDVNLGANSIRGENVNVNEGTLTDPSITDIGGLQVSVATVDCLIRSDAVYGTDGWLYRATVPAATLTVTDNAVNHIYVAWNAGSPMYVATTDRSALNLSDALPVARVLVQAGVVVAQLPFGFMGRSAAIRWLLREVRITDPVGGVRESGLTLSETATRVVNVASGTAWFVLNYLVLPGIAQGGVGVVSYLLHHTAGVWTKTTITQYNNTQYDNGINLLTLTNNRYAVNWVYRSFAGPEILIVLGTGDYSAPNAIDSQIPTTPSYVREFYYLCGRIIVQKNASTAYTIENATTTQFATVAAVDHNDLDGLQGGTFGEYYHLTSAEHATLVGGYVPYTGATGDLDLATHSLYADNVPFTEGVVTDPVITDATGVAVAITSCEVLIRSDPAWGGDERLYRMTVPAVANLALTDNTVNYIDVIWNGGSPIYAATTDRFTINFSNRIPVARVGMESGSIEYQLMYGYLAKGSTSRNSDRVLKTRGRGGIERESGLGISESATRVVSIGSGAVWFGLQRFSLSAVTSGVGGTGFHLWYHSSGVWTNTTITQYNNTQYDNGTNLATLTPNRYGVNWVYRNLVTNEIDIILGTGDYTLAQAEASTLPSIPEMVAAFYVLCGRIIVQKNASTATTIENVSTTTFNTSAVSIHNDLSGIQGGTTGEYYHLTSAQHTALGVATSITPGTPASGGATGTAGQILYDSGYLYVCTATNTWKRVTLNAF